MAKLQVNNLSVRIPTPDGGGYAVNQVSFEVQSGQVVCLVGESGCGKSTTALGIMRLLSDSVQLSGAISLDDTELLSLSEEKMCNIRGNKMSMVFQEPMTALNPVQTIGAQVAEPLIIHGKATRKSALHSAIELLEQVGIPNASQRIRHYPHQLSGGQRQRVVIAMALACAPDFIIADEPTTALDTTVQRQILKLLLDLVDTTGTGLLMITHNLAVVSEIADHVLVMYAGRIVESGSTHDVFHRPAHPYTLGLLAALPSTHKTERLLAIPGTVPSLSAPSPGCAFANRCSWVQPQCQQTQPELLEVHPQHMARCFYAKQILASDGASHA
ncbi:ABC transporter ATP-binding protein [Alcaligenaceae bacterium]|nr:ABC transporter ATP-binding protein [Alcaligenaceae bacterium]